MTTKQSYDMNARQNRKREEQIYALDDVSMARAIEEMKEALELYVPKEYWDTATFGHALRSEPYSDSEYSRFFVWWISPETDKELAERVAQETKWAEQREKGQWDQYQELKKKYEGK